ncbi:MAG: binding-protein-dependent transport system inner rane component [Chloroflexi bacterium]|nr:binding-protein-dependent transport system inner rane component [Chloroflexota bacterium]
MVANSDAREPHRPAFVSLIVTSVARTAASVFVPLIAFAGLWQGFLFLRDTDAPRPIVAGIAIVWGVGGVALLYVVANWVVERFPRQWRDRVLPFVFVGPAVVILFAYLLIPTILTLVLSFQDGASKNFVGAENYIFAVTNPSMIEAIRNNVLWLAVGTGGSVSLGLLMAILADRVPFERLAKVLIFLPMAISFVGAGVIWRFVYAYRPAGEEQIGLINAILGALGIAPQGLLQLQFWNNFLLIAILIWAQTGFAMVILSAALKGVPAELLEAARIDGASEVKVFQKVVIPSIRGSIITVSTTIAILTLKIYDIVTTMTNGNFGTEVIATLQFKQSFTFFDYGKGAALAIILLVAVMPVIWYNLRRFRGQEGFR